MQLNYPYIYITNYQSNSKDLAGGSGRRRLKVQKHFLDLDHPVPQPGGLLEV